ncbi:LexA family protein [Candidatus Acetatifactor stercoripullorum]|uniref:LexA family protein n=1 Tax=Candidatus Acetatifactor stercoripullorum TaxID=2838414 RepID=UPI00298E4EC8|nr:XRE family transcriptional regulator [Candidatus Acetatifactor stercoripullorum]
MTVGERIKDLRERLNISQVDFANKINVSKQTLYKYENNIITNIPSDKIEAVAKIGNISPAYLMGWDINSSVAIKKGISIPVLGRVAAGIPIEAIEDIIDTEEITKEMAKTGQYFGLKIKGSSMEPKISDGDIIIVRCQDYADSGDIVVATVNGTDATCKRIRKYRDGIELISNNPEYPPKFYSNKQIAELPIRILGKVVELRAKF